MRLSGVSDGSARSPFPVPADQVLWRVTEMTSGCSPHEDCCSEVVAGVSGRPSIQEQEDRPVWVLVAPRKEPLREDNMSPRVANFASLLLPRLSMNSLFRKTVSFPFPLNNMIISVQTRNTGRMGDTSDPIPQRPPPNSASVPSGHWCHAPYR